MNSNFHRFLRFLPVSEEIEIYEETMQQSFKPGGTRDVVAVEAWGSDHKIHRQEIRVRSGLFHEDPRHPEALYSMLERRLESLMRAAGVWNGERTHE